MTIKLHKLLYLFACLDNCAPACSGGAFFPLYTLTFYFLGNRRNVPQYSRQKNLCSVSRKGDGLKCSFFTKVYLTEENKKNEGCSQQKTRWQYKFWQSEIGKIVMARHSRIQGNPLEPRSKFRRLPFPPVLFNTAGI